MDTIEKAFSYDDQKVSREHLKDVYFMTKKQREVANFYESQHISDNLDESVKDKAKRLIDAMEDKSSFINAKFAVGYRLDRMKHADESSRKP